MGLFSFPHIDQNCPSLPPLIKPAHYVGAGRLTLATTPTDQNAPDPLPPAALILPIAPQLPINKKRSIYPLLPHKLSGRLPFSLDHIYISSKFRNIMMSRFAFLVLAIFVLAGCASDQAARYFADEHYPPRPDDQVQVLDAAPPQPYTLLAELQARDMPTSDMRHWAAKLGADAIIVTRLGGQKARSDVWASEDTQGTTAASRVAGIAIKYSK